MKDFSRKVMSFVRDEEGLTMVEYAIAGSLVAAGTVLAFTNLGRGIRDAINGLIGHMGGGA
jgi:pilus assembly protein Flp/PilA